jgi:hypothetical protein
VLRRHLPHAAPAHTTPHNELKTPLTATRPAPQMGTPRRPGGARPNPSQAAAAARSSSLWRYAAPVTPSPRQDSGSGSGVWQWVWLVDPISDAKPQLHLRALTIFLPHTYRPSTTNA